MYWASRRSSRWSARDLSCDQREHHAKRLHTTKWSPPAQGARPAGQSFLPQRHPNRKRARPIRLDPLIPLLRAPLARRPCLHPIHRLTLTLRAARGKRRPQRRLLLRPHRSRIRRHQQHTPTLRHNPQPLLGQRPWHSRRNRNAVRVDRKKNSDAAAAETPACSLPSAASSPTPSRSRHRPSAARRTAPPPDAPPYCIPGSPDPPHTPYESPDRARSPPPHSSASDR